MKNGVRDGEDRTFECLSDAEVTVLDPKPDTEPAQLPRTIRADDHDDVSCRAREMLDRIGDKWSLAVVHQLGWGPRRFTELKNSVEGISQRMLTATLRGLERDGLVKRTIHPVVPPRVDYELTPLGVGLVETVCAMLRWTVAQRNAIERARADYDRRRAAERQETSSAALTS